MAAARLQNPEPETSVFAGLRRLHPELQPQLLSKTTLTALSRAMEDECCARAERPVLFVSFQRQRFYHHSEQRWANLARTGKAVVVFADFPESEKVASLLKIPVPRNAPLRREWAFVCDSPNYPAALAGWELPDQRRAADGERRFETLWTVDPAAVRHAARICIALVRQFAPGHAPTLGELLEGDPAPASGDLKSAAALLNRMVGYLEAARGR